MANYHPTLDMLTEHAAGSMPLAQAVCVSIHIGYCSSCRMSASLLHEVGAELFEGLAPLPVDDAQLDAVLARLDEQPRVSSDTASTVVSGQTPALLQRLMRGDFTDLVWQKMTKSLRISYLKTGDPRYELALYHVKAGGYIPAHDHRGGEMTLVLQGGFSDANGNYDEGDFIFREPNQKHAPTALQSEDCISLVVLDAPLKFTDWIYRWVNPFLRFKGG